MKFKGVKKEKISGSDFLFSAYKGIFVARSITIGDFDKRCSQSDTAYQTPTSSYFLILRYSVAMPIPSSSAACFLLL